MTRMGSANASCALANGTPCFAWFSWSLPGSQSNPVFAMGQRLARIWRDSHTFVWLPYGGLCDPRPGSSTCRNPRGARLLGLDAGGLGDLGEPGDFALDVGGELLGRTGRDLQPLGGKRSLHVRSAQNLDGFGVEAPDDRARGSRGREQSEP